MKGSNMIKLYMGMGAIDKLDASERFMFERLFTDDDLKIAVGYAIGTYDELYDMSRLLEYGNHDTIMKYNNKDFKFEDAPEHYAVIIPVYS